MFEKGANIDQNGGKISYMRTLLQFGSPMVIDGRKLSRDEENEKISEF